MATRNRDRLLRLVDKDPHCYWCGKIVVYFIAGDYQKQPQNTATIDHLYSRKEPRERFLALQRSISSGIESHYVLSCLKCNSERSWYQQHRLPMPHYFIPKGGDNMTNQIDTTRVDKTRQLLDQALQLLREDRDVRANAKQSGGLELSEAITCFETGSMYMIRSLFADQPYTPMLKLQPADNQPTPAAQAAAKAQKPSSGGGGTSAPAA